MYHQMEDGFVISLSPEARNGISEMHIALSLVYRG
jgi:hypothetical protein